MRPAKIEYVLSTSCTDYVQKDGDGPNVLTARSFKNVKSSDQTRFSFHANLMNKRTLGIDLDKALGALGDADKEKEAALLQRLFDFVQEDDRLDQGDLTRAVKDYIRQSKIFKGKSRKLLGFLNKFNKSAQVMAQFNSAAQGSDRKMSRAQNKAVRRLRRIWGDRVTIRNNAAAELGKDLGGFRSLIDDFDEKTPPLSFKSEVTYDLRVKKLKLPEIFSLRRAFGAHKHFAKTVLVWQLPSHLFAIQSKLGIMPEDAPKFRLCADVKDGDQSFRVCHEGNEIDDMLEGLSEKLAADERFIEGDGRPMQLTFHNYAEQLPVFLQTPEAPDFEDLKSKIRGAVKGVDFKKLRKFRL